MRISPLFGAAILAGLLASPALRAETQMVQGSDLSLTASTDNETTIEPDSSLHGQVRIVSAGDACVRPSGDGGSIRLDTGACGDRSGPITVLVPPEFPVHLTSSASGDVSVGNLIGPIEAIVQGSGDLKIGHVKLLQLHLRSSADVTIASTDVAADLQIEGSGTTKIQHAAGSVRITQRGSGDVSIAESSVAAADIETQGSGDTLISTGTVGALRVRLAGSGDVSINATATVADLRAEGGGDIHLAHVNGPVQRYSTGGSDITIASESGTSNIDVQALQQLKQSFSTDELKPLMHMHRGSDTSWIAHLAAGLIVLALMVAAWRTIQKHGRHLPLFNSSTTPPAGPVHPGVIALCERLTQLDSRLARVETHVMSKEFELNRQFRDMEARR